MSEQPTTTVYIVAAAPRNCSLPKPSKSVDGMMYFDQKDAYDRQDALRAKYADDADWGVYRAAVRIVERVGDGDGS